MSVATAGTLAAATAVAAALLALSLRGERAPRLALRHPDRGALADAGWRHGIGRWEQIRAGVAATALTVAVVSGAPAALVLAALFAPSIWIRLRAEAARERARRALPGILVTAGSALRSGASLPDALRRAIDASEADLSARPFAHALRSFDMGGSLDASLRDAALTCADDRTRVAMGSLALGISERLPRERLAELVAAVAERASFDERLREEVRARAAGARQQQMLLAGLVPLLAAYLSLTMPTLAAVLASELGRFVLIPAALALEVAGIAFGRRVVTGAIR